MSQRDWWKVVGDMRDRTLQKDSEKSNSVTDSLSKILCGYHRRGIISHLVCMRWGRGETEGVTFKEVRISRNLWTL